jgi:CheY-like chemotaxis protein
MPAPLDKLEALVNYAFGTARQNSSCWQYETSMTERIYRLTQSGRDAWESQDAAVPADYRRLLWLMDFHGHAGLMREMMMSAPRHVLDEWLAEMEELGLIEQVPAGREEERDFALPRDDKTLALEQARLQQEAQAAGAALQRTGAYLALDRLKYRRITPKPAAETEILVIEDDPDQLALADLRMTMAGYKVRVATSVNAFLQSMFDDGAPDLLLLDVELPDGDGFDVLARMRRHKVLSALPIIMLTVRSDPADIGKGLALGADGYVTKPYTKSILADVVRRILGSNV